MSDTGDPENVDAADVPMNVRSATLADGRYLIYYTFGDDADRSP